jgi:SlyX protein
MEERFCTLETKLAYQENELAELSQVLFRQQQVIDKMEAQLRRVMQQLGELGFTGDTRPDQKPPHY